MQVVQKLHFEGVLQHFHGTSAPHLDKSCSFPRLSTSSCSVTKTETAVSRESRAYPLEGVGIINMIKYQPLRKDLSQLSVLGELWISDNHLFSVLNPFIKLARQERN